MSPNEPIQGAQANPPTSAELPPWLPPRRALAEMLVRQATAALESSRLACHPGMSGQLPDDAFELDRRAVAAASDLLHRATLELHRYWNLRRLEQDGAIAPLPKPIPPAGAAI